MTNDRMKASWETKIHSCKEISFMYAFGTYFEARLDLMQGFHIFLSNVSSLALYLLDVFC
jgi:hypothetical protein